MVNSYILTPQLIELVCESVKAKMISDYPTL